MTQFLPATVPARNRNGEPAGQAKWDFYYENTLTAAPLVGGATSVTAGSTGIFPGITLDTNLSYRAVLKDADGRVISDITSVIDRYFAAGSKEAVENSALVPGARWKFYNAGTTTPRPVFADPALAVSLGASVEADASARFPEIYLNSASAYKAVLERPDGTVIGTIDPVNASTMEIFLAGIGADGTYVLDGTLYGPHYGPRGPKQIIIAPFNQADVGYCFETNNVAENLPAKWASRGINAMKVTHPDAALQGRGTQFLTATKNAGLMLLGAPTWPQYAIPVGDPNSLDLRNLAVNDAYWRTKWIQYMVLDEIDIVAFPLSVHTSQLNGWSLGGVSKPVTANFTRRVAVPSASQGSSTINFFEAFNVPQITSLSLDSYEWHFLANTSNVATDPGLRSSGDTFISTWHGDGVYDDALRYTNNSIGRRFTASVTGRAVHLMRNGPVKPGYSDSGNMPVQYPPSDFNTPPGVKGIDIFPQPMAYAPGDKATGHYIATGRVELANSQYPGSGKWQPGRFLRSEAWSGFVHGSSSLYLFPQTVGSGTATGYVDAVANTLVITSEPVRPFIFGGALQIRVPGDLTYTLRGWVRRDNPQLSGTTGGAGTYALDVAKGTPVATGSVGSPVTLSFITEGFAWSDDSNPENLTELAGVIDNLERMQAHPTGGNLLIDTVQGGRRAFSVMRCPDIDGDLGLYREDMTLAPVQAGYTSGGVAIPDDAGSLPLWDFGWPVGFEGFRVVGDDGATYLYVRSMSNNRMTFFPGYAALGLPARVFGPFELAGFRRVGVGTAVEMTSTSAVIKAGVDDGAATWFYIETAAITQNEGNSGSTAYAVTVRRGGNLSGTNTVTATVSGVGLNPANAADFGGTFPTQVLSFGPTEATKVFTVNVSGDATAEFNETFAVTLSAPSAGTVLVGSGKDKIVCTITNDDAALVGAFVWLGASLTGAPALDGSPLGAVHLNWTETANVTRGGVTMRGTAGNAYNDSWFADMPAWTMGSPAFHNIYFELAAGNWEVAFLTCSSPFGGGLSGTVQMIDDPAGAATVRQTCAVSASGTVMVDTDDTEYTNQLTGIQDAVNNLTFLPVTITDIGGGNGLLRITVSSGSLQMNAVAVRQA